MKPNPSQYKEETVLRPHTNNMLKQPRKKVTKTNKRLSSCHPNPKLSKVLRTVACFIHCSGDTTEDERTHSSEGPEEFEKDFRDEFLRGQSGVLRLLKDERKQVRFSPNVAVASSPNIETTISEQENLWYHDEDYERFELTYNEKLKRAYAKVIVDEYKLNKRNDANEIVERLRRSRTLAEF